MNLPAIPTPEDYDTRAAVELASAAIAWLEEADDIQSVHDVQAQLLALERYVETKDPAKAGEIRMAARRADARIGQLLGPTYQGARSLTRARVSDLVSHGRRPEFRTLASRMDEWWPEKAKKSRAQVLDYLKRLDRQNDDRAARHIQSTDRQHTAGDGWVMTAGDAAEILPELPDASVDMIVTDPPYPAESIDLWSLLGEHAARVLVPQGVLCALSGKIHLPDVIDRLRAHLSYAWVYCEPLPGSTSRILARHVGQSWKPWLAFSNGAWPSGRIDWHPDLLDGAPMAKRHYTWEQSTGPAAQLIEFLCPEKGIVLDPFAGSGSYGVAAIQTGRRFVGIDADADRYATACTRLKERAEP